MSRPTDYLSFGGGQFLLILPDRNLWAPRPQPAQAGGWTHVPFGGNVWETDSSSLQTTWQIEGGIKIRGAADYDTMRALAGRFAPLVTPWGTFNARLQPETFKLSRHDDGSYRGQAVFEWAG